MCGWWYTYPSEKYELMCVCWEDEIPNWMESHKIHVPKHKLPYIRYIHHLLIICYPLHATYLWLFNIANWKIPKQNGAF